MRLTTLLQRAAGAVMVTATLASGAVSAQTFSAKPISLLVPYPAGGPSDVVARLVQPELAKQLAATVVVENLSGVGGALGVQKMLNAPADGHSVLVGSPMELILAPLGVAAVKYNPEDSRLIAVLGQTTIALYVRKDFPENSVEGLIAHARKSGGQLSYGSAGAGSLHHLVAERFRAQTGVDMLHVPYKGTTPLVQDLMGGQIDLVFMPFGGSMVSLVDTGKMRLLGLASASRDPRYPKIPTLAESGVLNDFVYDSWVGLQVSKTTPQAIVAKLGDAAREAIKAPEIRQTIESTGGSVPKSMSQTELDKYYQGEIARYRSAARAVNLQPQ